MMEKDGYKYRIHYTCSHKFHDNIYFNAKSRTVEFFYLSLLFWRRLFVVLAAGNYKTVFFQRNLFSLYYDQKTPYLEKLICKINPNVTVDFFDADYERNPEFYNAIARCCNKVSVVNDFLAQYFKKYNSNVLINDLGLNLTKYEIKNNYELSAPIKIFWTGSIYNVIYLETIIPVLEKINESTPLELLMICKVDGGFKSKIIRHLQWNEKTFFKLLAESDISLYPLPEDTVFSRGKVAYKSLEYAAAAIPMVGSPFGLSPHFKDGEDILIANTTEEWEQKIRTLILNSSLRKNIGTSARNKVEQFHSISSTYQKFLEILKK